MASQTFSIKLTANGKEVQELQEALRKQANEYEKQLDDINEKLKERDKLSKEEIKDLTQQSNSLAAKIKALGTAVEENITNLRKVDDVMKNLSGSSGAELGKALRGIGQQMKRVSDQTLKSGETMEQKLTEIKEKMIEVRHEMVKREGIDGLTRAKASLQDLANTPLDKLKMGLDSIEKKLSTMSEAEKQAADGMTLLEGRARYRAQMAVTEQGRADNGRDINAMNADQLRAEQQRLRQGYMATEGAKGYETISQEYLNRLQQVNRQIQTLTQTEREYEQVNMKSQQTAATLTKLFGNQKVTLTELQQAEENLQESIKRREGKNLSPVDQQALKHVKFQLDEVKRAISEISLDSIDFDSLENEPVERLEKLLKQLEADEKRLAATDKQASEQMASNKRKVQQAIQRVKNQTIDLADAQKVASERGKHSAQDMQRAYDTLKQHLATLSTSQKKEIAETRQQMKQLKADIDSVTGAVSNQNSVWSTAVRNITAYVGVFGMFNFVKNKLQEVIRGSAELSDRMADIRKVSGLTMQEIEDLTRTLAKMDTRTTLNELEQIAYRGAKLGFGEFGTEGLLEFTRAANQVNVALREDLGDEALGALSKITENMGLIKKMGVEDAMLATASSMFKLAASSTAAAGPIVEVTKRLVPVAQMSGYATHEILALASASDSLHLMPEVVGTALSKMIMAMQNNHNLVEKYLTIPEGTLASMFKAGQSMDALLLVMDKMRGKNVTELDGLWKLLGSDGQRLITVVADMANHTDTLRKHLELSTKAFMEGTAVTEEYNIQQQTAQALLERADNLWRNAFINPDSSLSVKEMANSWYEFSKSVLQSDWSLGAIKVTIDTLLVSLRLLINLLPMITFGLMAKGAAMLYEKLSLAKIAADGFTLSWKKMDAATKSNWIGLAVGLLAQGVYWIKQWADAAADAELEQRKMNVAIEGMHEKTDREIDGLNRLKGMMTNVNNTQEDRNKLLAKANSDYSAYLNYLGIELNSVQDLIKNYDALTKVMRQRFAYQEREDYKREKMGGEDGSRMKRRMAGSELTKLGKEYGVNIDLDVLGRYVNGKQTANDSFREFLGAERQAQLAGVKFANLQAKWVAYITRARLEIKEETEINDAFANDIGDFNYDKWLREQVKGEFKISPDKKAERERKEGMRKDLRDEREKAKAIIDNVKNYYQRQINAVTDMANLGTIDEQTQKQMTDGLTERMNTALANVRKAIGGTKNDWEEFKKSMREDLYEPLGNDGSNFSTELLDKVMDNNLIELRKMIQTLSKALGQNGSVLLDQILRKATESEGKNVSQTNKLMRAREKELLERNYTGKVDLDYQNTMEQFGIGGITTEQTEQIRNLSQQNDSAAIKKFFDDRTKLWQQGFEQARKNIIDLYKIDIEKEGGVNDLMELLYGKDYKSTLQGSALEGLLNMDSSQWRIYYMKLIEYNDQWIDAQKKAYDEHKKREDYLFKNRPDVLSIDTTTQQLSQLEQQRNLFGQDATFGRQMGMVDTISNDPELMRYDLLQARAEMYYNKMYELRQQDLISEEQLKDAREQMTQAQINMQQKLMEAVQSRTQTIQNAIQPITDFAEQAGMKLGDMMFNMQSQSMTWNQIWKNMLLAMGKSIIQMGQQYAIQKLQRAMFNKQIEADEEMHQALLTAIAIGGAIARTTGELQIENGALVAKKVINGQEVTEEISLATILTALGISKGAAKTIGALGWLGIPLIAVISSLLMGLLTSALSTAGAESSSSSTSAAKTKTVSGMLTYKNGNVQEVTGGGARGAMGGRRMVYDDGNVQVWDRQRPHPVVGTDGRVYMVTDQEELRTGLVTQPIATTVNGRPAIVGETGPEVVIGRDTTAAIMRKEPELLNRIAEIDKQHSGAGQHAATGSPFRPLAKGNVGETRETFEQVYHGSDGRNYMAKTMQLPEGVTAITQPIATMVNGQPGLVAERGPEIVIGRETTRRLMMNQPDLLRAIATVDAGHAARRLRTYDEGTGVPSVAMPSQPQQPADQQAQQDQNERLAEALDQNTQMMAAFVQMMNTIQQRGIPAHINKYGPGGLVNEVKSGLKFDSRYNR